MTVKTNMVTSTCPYCGHTGKEYAVGYTPFAAMANKSPFTNAKGEGLETTGELECEKCDKKFLYKFAAYVKCESAKMPEFN